MKVIVNVSISILTLFVFAISMCPAQITKDEPTRELLIKELNSLLPDAKSVSPERSQYLWQNLKLYIKKGLGESFGDIPAGWGNPNPQEIFFQELKGNSEIVSAKTPFKIVGNELKIAGGAFVQLNTGERFFFLEGTWRKLGKQNVQIDTCLQKIRKLEEREIEEYNRQGPVRYSTISGILGDN